MLLTKEDNMNNTLKLYIMYIVYCMDVNGISGKTAFSG